LLGGELIDCLQNNAGNVTDRQYLKSWPLRQSSPGSAISAATAVIVLFIFIYFSHFLCLFIRERQGEVSKKVKKIPETWMREAFISVWGILRLSVFGIGFVAMRRMEADPI
jgi:hypothetical protein